MFKLVLEKAEKPEIKLPTSIGSLKKQESFSGNSGWLYFPGLQNHCRWLLQPWNWKTLTPQKESYDQPRQHIKTQRHYFVSKGPSSQSYVFFQKSLWMCELEYKEIWALKNWCFWTVVLEKTKEIRPVNPKGNLSWIFIRRTHAETDAPIPWLPEEDNWFIGKDSKAQKDWGQEEKGMTEDKMVGWHHWFIELEFEETPGDGKGQGSLTYCSPWGDRVGHDWATE